MKGYEIKINSSPIKLNCLIILIIISLLFRYVKALSTHYRINSFVATSFI